MIGGDSAAGGAALPWERETAEETAGRWLRWLRPTDGWMALLFLTANLCVVVMAAERADWAPTPNMVGLLLLGMLTAFVFYRLSVWWWLAILPGLALGGLTVVWQMSIFTIDGEPLGGAAVLWERLVLWAEAADAGTINIDKVPFSFGLTTASWLTGYLGAWMYLRHRNFWGVFVLGGLGLLSNLTFLPPHTNLHLAMYVFTAMMVVARVQAVRRQGNWERRGIQYDEGLRSLTVSDSFFIAVAVIIVTFLLPVSGNWKPATDAYESMRQPLIGYEDDFNRLFAGLPARRAIGFRVWDDVMAFQGTINPATTPVLQVDSPAPLYWKARTYGTYTSKGWISEDTGYIPIGDLPETPPHAAADNRVEVGYTVHPLYSAKVLFAGGSVSGVDRDVEAEVALVHDPTTDAILVSGVPNERVRSMLESIQRDEADRIPSARERINGLPLPSWVNVTVNDDAPKSAPDVLSIRSRSGLFPAYEPYHVTTWVSTASPEQLREAGDEYPLHVFTRYTQLTRELPERVKDLAVSITADAETSYDKALAVEAYLKTLPYSLEMSPPPYDADGVDHFLFDQGKGYSEYFSSAMAVMLRSVGVPARVAAGYTTGDPIGEVPAFAVADNHSHGWVEVYFPGYDWIPFEPTPGSDLPVVMAPGGAIGADFDGSYGSGLDFDCIDELDFECGVPLEGLPGEGSSGAGFAGEATPPAWVWLLVALGVAAATALVLRWAHRRYLSEASEPEIVYRHLRELSAFGGLTGARPRTPYQFGRLLARRLPACRESLDVIVDSYVRSRYGAKTQSTDDSGALADAWLSVRYPLLRLSLLCRARIL